MVCGAFVFNAYTGPCVELTIMCSLPLSVRIVRFIARLAFVELNAERLQVHTELGNTRARKAIESIGFRFEGVARRYFGKRNALTYALLRDEQKVIRHARTASA
jgi:hypothetical protein